MAINRFKETTQESMDREAVEQSAVAGYLELHYAEQGSLPERHVTAGQLTFLCLSCGDYRTIDNIKAEANKALERE